MCDDLDHGEEFAPNTRERAKQMREAFYVPRNEDRLLGKVNNLLSEAPPEYAAVLRSFADSISSINSVLSLPYTMAEDSVSRALFHNYFMAESIRGLPDAAEEETEAEEDKQTRQRIAHERASKKFDEFLSTPDGRDKYVYRLSQYLMDFVESDAPKMGRVKCGFGELLLQGVVLVWSAFEMACRDVAERFVDRNPTTVSHLLENPTLKKRLGSFRFQVEVLAEYEFDLSKSMGEVLLSGQDFSDLPTLKAVAKSLVVGNDYLYQLLDSPKLWQ